MEWTIQIALGLQYLHEHNVLHRDLKTQNIFLTKNRIVKVRCPLSLSAPTPNSTDANDLPWSAARKSGNSGADLLFLFFPLRTVSGNPDTHSYALASCPKPQVGDLGIAKVLESQNDMATTVSSPPSASSRGDAASDAVQCG